MEIRYLSQEEKENSRVLYEEVFVEDEKAFVDAYYKIKAADNEILAVMDEESITAMLHRNPYTFRFRDKSLRADYLVAVATRRSYRHQGLMRRLLTRALQDMEREKQPFAFLMPADEAIYLPFDFRLMGNEYEEGLASMEEKLLSETYDLYIEKTYQLAGMGSHPHDDAPGASAFLCITDWSRKRTGSAACRYRSHPGGESRNLPLAVHHRGQPAASGHRRAGAYGLHCGSGKLSLRHDRPGRTFRGLPERKKGRDTEEIICHSCTGGDLYQRNSIKSVQTGCTETV